jgi:hypothetical protein
MRNAYNFVVGEIPSGVLTGEGSLLNRDTFNSAPWLPPVGSNDDSIQYRTPKVIVGTVKKSIAPIASR